MNFWLINQSPPGTFVYLRHVFHFDFNLGTRHTHFCSFVSRCHELCALEFLYSVSLVLQFLSINRKNQ